MEKDFIIYNLPNGKEPLTDWIDDLKDLKARSIIRARLARVRSGNLGKWEYLTDGVSELKFKFSAGYRVYYSELDKIVLLLLCGGDKSSQKRDIKKAIEYLNDYKERTND